MPSSADLPEAGARAVAAAAPAPLPVGDEVDFLDQPVVAFVGPHLDRPGREVVAQRRLAEGPGNGRPRPVRVADVFGDGAPVRPLELFVGRGEDAEAERVGEEQGAERGAESARGGRGDRDPDRRQQRHQRRDQVAGEDEILARLDQRQRDRDPDPGGDQEQRPGGGAPLPPLPAPQQERQRGEAEGERHEGEPGALGPADDVAGLTDDEGRGRFPEPMAEAEVADPVGVAERHLVERHRRHRDRAADQDRRARRGSPAARAGAAASAPRRGSGRRRSSGCRSPGPTRSPTRRSRGARRPRSARSQ